MTEISPDARARAPHRRVTRRVVATAAAVVVALGLASPAAADTTPSPTPTPTPTGVLDLTLAPLSNGVARAGQSLTVMVELDNGTLSDTAAVPATLSIGTEPLADRRALQAWLAGETAPPMAAVATAELPITAGGEDSATPISVPADDPSLAGRAAGVYPIEARTTVAGEDLASSSVLIVPSDAAANPVGVVVPITAGPLETGLLDSDQLATLTAVDGDLTAQLSAVAGTSAILAIDPAIPAAIRVLGSAAPPSAVEWLTQLDQLPNPRFALQYGDADIAAQLASGVSAPLQPTSLLSYMDPANFVTVEAEDATDEASAGDTEDDASAPTPTPTTLDTPTPTPTAVPDGPVYPELAELLAVGDSARAGVFWPATGSADAEVTAALAPLGTPATPALTLVSSASTRSGEGGAIVGAHATTGTAELLVYDAAVSATLRDAADTDDATDRAALTSEATAQLAFATAEAGGRPLLVTLDRGVDRTRPALRSTLTAATLAPGVAAVTLDELAATAPAPVDLTDTEASEQRTAATTMLVDDEAALEGFATILDDPQLLTGPERAEILQLLGVAWGEDAEATGAAIAAHRAATRETLDAVSILPSVEIILASYQSDLPRTVRNELPYPVNVTLVAQPDDARLSVEERTEVSAQAASNTRVAIPVEARIGNGSVAVAMQLYSPTGVVIGGPASTSVEVHADWETIGLAVLIALMVVFIGLGIIRTVLARRSRRREAEATDMTAVSDTPAEPAEPLDPETLEPSASTADPEHPEDRA